MSLPPRVRGRPVGSGAGEKRKAAADYSTNPHTMKAQKRIHNATGAEAEFRRLKQRLNTRMTRAKKMMIQEHQNWDSLSKAEQEAAIQQTKVQVHQDAMESGCHPAQFDPHFFSLVPITPPQSTSSPNTRVQSNPEILRGSALRPKHRMQVSFNSPHEVSTEPGTNIHQSSFTPYRMNVQGLKTDSYDSQPQHIIEDDHGLGWEDVPLHELTESEQDLLVQFTNDLNFEIDEHDRRDIPSEHLQNKMKVIPEVIQHQTSVIGYRRFRAIWLATLDLLWLKLSCFYRFPEKTQEIFKEAGITKPGRIFPQAQDFLTLEEIFLLLVLQRFSTTKVSRRKKKVLQKVDQVQKWKRQWNLRTRCARVLKGYLITNHTRSRRFPFHIPVRKQIQDILGEVGNSVKKNWVELPGPAGIWHDIGQIRTTDMEVLNMVLCFYGHKLALIPLWLQMPVFANWYPKAWNRFDDKVMFQVFSFSFLPDR